MSQERWYKYKEFVNTVILDDIHKAIQMSKIMRTMRPLTEDELNDKEHVHIIETIKKQSYKEFMEDGERLKKAINQFIDLQLNAYWNFNENDEDIHDII